MVDAHLKRLGYTVSRIRIRNILREIIPEEERSLKRIRRRQYFCRAPLSLVHIDSYHKCIRWVRHKYKTLFFRNIQRIYVIIRRWRFVLHGAIDGFSRKVLFLKLRNNNTASTALRSFKRATYKHMPSRLR